MTSRQLGRSFQRALARIVSVTSQSASERARLGPAQNRLNDYPISPFESNAGVNGLDAKQL